MFALLQKVFIRQQTAVRDAGCGNDNMSLLLYLCKYTAYPAMLMLLLILQIVLPANLIIIG